LISLLLNTTNSKRSCEKRGSYLDYCVELMKRISIENIGPISSIKMPFAYVLK